MIKTGEAGVRLPHVFLSSFSVAFGILLWQTRSCPYLIVDDPGGPWIKDTVPFGASLLVSIVSGLVGAALTTLFTLVLAKVSRRNVQE